MALALIQLPTVSIIAPIVFGFAAACLCLESGLILVPMYPSRVPAPFLLQPDSVVKKQTPVG